jgi:hypothetical protein
MKKYIKYSTLEKRILDEIPKDGSRINTVELAGRSYDAGKEPINARQSVLHALNSLIRKSDENEELWELFKSGGRPAYFWIMPRIKKDVA